jgi:alpha-beta hydrolase superfamily lysophospholipase
MMHRTRTALAIVAAAVLLSAAWPHGLGAADVTRDVVVRGKKQTVRVFGSPDGSPVVVSSGDGGWIHVAPFVTKLLAESGHYVIGVDCKAYLSSFTDGQKTLTTADVPEDYRTFVNEARAGRERRVFLVGASEGAGLSVLAASAAALKPSLEGVIGLGLPELNELGWRFRDSIIYLTHKAPKEPLFRSSEFVPLLDPVPLALIQSTHDDFVSPADIQRLMGLAGGPKRLWTIEARNHSFSGSEAEFRKAVDEALAWLSQQRAADAPRP